MKNSPIKSLLSLGFVGACIALTGCNVCEDTDAKFCADLGAEDCALWKEKELNFVAQAENGGGREKFPRSLIFGKGSTMCQSATNDAVYPQMLKAYKDQIAAVRAADEAVRKAGAAAE